MGRRELTEFESLLIELVHFLAYGTDTEEGLTLKETKYFLTQPIASRGGKNAIECLEEDRRRLLKEIKQYLSNRTGKNF